MVIPAIIPARSASKSVPNKNMRLLKGKPLLQWTIEAAARSRLIDKDHIYVSTDSPDYGRFAEKLGASWIRRPPALAEDVPTEDVILHAVKEAQQTDQEDAIWHFDPIVTLQCTTPLVDPEDIDGAIQTYQKGFYGSVVTITPCREQPAWMFEIQGKNLVPFTKGVKLKGDWGVRQTLKSLYKPNGAVYVTSLANLKLGSIIAYPIGYYMMPFERSYDVDEEVDLKVLEALVA